MKPLILMLHGMSTGPGHLKNFWGETRDFDVEYMALPILREGPEFVRTLTQHDIFRDLYAAVFLESLKEITTRIQSENEQRRTGLFGFSIGAYIALWAGLVDHPERIQAVVAVGGVPSFDYLRYYYPDYDFSTPHAVQLMEETDLSRRPLSLKGQHVLIQHGISDPVAQIDWIKPWAQSLAEKYPQHVSWVTYPSLQHRLWAESSAEEEDVLALRETTLKWFTEALGSASPRG
ncbi:alpha/beta hydrolase family protein [Sulfobacillus thermosulfidooxidans]|uniref:alpha/beta hydrolase family protein n=1 Tax=Sulfobacillus thermosulfidooxidans TaxID=28034 RepID=UPI0006B469F5|nr:prolyl oligopeptidase family serine peptidase [Sulfobacillus thermosulfidooxidans]